MDTSLHTFMSIFGENFERFGAPVKLQKIVIPIIQRDYAQGRTIQEVVRVRNRFLDALYNAVTQEPITLDVVYGDINEGGTMTPLDGQQRLTTLFLLHWYAAKKEKISVSEYKFLSKFSYATRYSAREFCSLLIQYQPSFEEGIGEEIMDQPWFPLDWNNDPTINGMLVMLESIDEKFKRLDNLWERLRDGAITFYFWPIKEMGLTDDLYIKMNSRGKPLTLFEHFKAELEHELNEVSRHTAKRVIRKIDIDWTEMLWKYRGENNIIDDEFLRYFHFICDILYYKKGDTPQGKSADEFDLVKTFFSMQSEEIEGNIKLLEDFFDCWCKFDDSNTTAMFFESFLAKEHESGKIRVENRYMIDVFEDCLRNNAGVTGNGNRTFALNRIVLLYAFIMYLLNKEQITDKQFARRIRIVNNLIRNSEDEISDSVSRQGGNRMPNILRQVDSIILKGEIDMEIERSFNVLQLKEEKEKLLWVSKHSDYEEDLYELEDHDLLYGQIGIVGLDKPEYFKRFISLFHCDWDKIDCALMSIGNYAQKEKNEWRYQVGSKRNMKAWRNLFHRSAAHGFEQTKECLRNLLSKAEVFSDDILTDIAKDYLMMCESDALYEWRYYYIKYGAFRAGRFGKYAWNDFDNKPYELAAMHTERNYSTNTYQPFLKEIDARHLWKDWFGLYLVYADYYVECANNAFVLHNLDTEEEIERLEIKQNENGIDTEDRIKKYIDFYNIVKESEDLENDIKIRDVIFHLNIRGADASGVENGKKFTVLKGSKISSNITPSLSDNHRELRDQLMDDNIIRNGIFNENHTFSTVSAAACVVSGRPANGWIEWLTDDGITYQEMKRHAN